VTEPVLLSENTFGIGTELSVPRRALEVIVGGSRPWSRAGRKSRRESLRRGSRLHHHGRMEMVAGPWIRRAAGIDFERSGHTDHVPNSKHGAQLLDQDHSSSTWPATRSIGLANGDAMRSASL
jgi:hypothetical protein